MTIILERQRLALGLLIIVLFFMASCVSDLDQSQSLPINTIPVIKSKKVLITELLEEIKTKEDPQGHYKQVGVMIRGLRSWNSSTRLKFLEEILEDHVYVEPDSSGWEETVDETTRFKVFEILLKDKSPEIRFAGLRFTGSMLSHLAQDDCEDLLFGALKDTNSRIRIGAVHMILNTYLRVEHRSVTHRIRKKAKALLNSADLSQRAAIYYILSNIGLDEYRRAERIRKGIIKRDKYYAKKKEDRHSTRKSSFERDLKDSGPHLLLKGQTLSELLVLKNKLDLEIKAWHKKPRSSKLKSDMDLLEKGFKIRDIPSQ